MIELITALIVLFVGICIRIHRAVKRLAAQERDYIEEQRMFYNTKVCFLYDWTKFILTTAAILATVYIFVCLACGEVIGLRHLTNAKFWKIAGGCAVVLLGRLILCRFLSLSINLFQR